MRLLSERLRGNERSLAAMKEDYDEMVLNFKYWVKTDDFIQHTSDHTSWGGRFFPSFNSPGSRGDK